jgi:DNA-binding transcriptional MerR regulator
MFRVAIGLALAFAFAALRSGLRPRGHRRGTLSRRLSWTRAHTPIRWSPGLAPDATARRTVREVMNDRESRTWSVGELAAACGVTVRTLHHYDRLGLVVPSTRTAAGHRRYLAEDVRRLYQVVALRRLGLGLETIATWLASESPADLLVLVRDHLDAIDQQVRRHQQLRDRLACVAAVLERAGRITSADLLGVMEAMGIYDEHLTPEQLAQLERDREALGFPGLEAWRLDAAAAVSTLKAAFETGADPGDPHVQDLVRRIRELKRQFVGDTPAVTRALRQVHADPQWDTLRALVPSQPELQAFWRRARQTANG